jgi:hypothetical protein
MPEDRLMDICLTCDHCRIVFGTSDLPLWKRKALDVKISRLTNRDRIKRIFCRRGVIRDTDGAPREYRSLTAIKSAEKIKGRCPYWDGENEDY